MRPKKPEKCVVCLGPRLGSYDCAHADTDGMCRSCGEAWAKASLAMLSSSRARKDPQRWAMKWSARRARKWALTEAAICIRERKEPYVTGTKDYRRLAIGMGVAEDLVRALLVQS